MNSIFLKSTSKKLALAVALASTTLVSQLAASLGDLATRELAE